MADTPLPVTSESASAGRSPGVFVFGVLGSPPVAERFFGLGAALNIFAPAEVSAVGTVPGGWTWGADLAFARLDGAVPALFRPSVLLIFTEGEDLWALGRSTEVLREKFDLPVYLCEISDGPSALWAGEVPFPCAQVGSFGPLDSWSFGAVLDSLERLSASKAPLSTPSRS